MPDLANILNKLQQLNPDANWTVAEGVAPMFGPVLRLTDADGFHCDFSLRGEQTTMHSWRVVGSEVEVTNVHFLSDIRDLTDSQVALNISSFMDTFRALASNPELARKATRAASRQKRFVDGGTQIPNWAGWVSALAVGVVLMAFSFIGSPNFNNPRNTDSNVSVPSIQSPSDAEEPFVLDLPSQPNRGTGYIVVCKDGWISHSGGRQGACSHHGGVAG
jgi:hypothetical protein